MVSSSRDEYLNEVGVTGDSLNQVVRCVEHRQELLKSAQASKRTLEEIAGIRSGIPASLRLAAERFEHDRGIITGTTLNENNLGIITGTTLNEPWLMFGQQADTKIKPARSIFGSAKSPEEGEWKRHKQVMDLHNQELGTLKDVYSLLAADTTTNQDMTRLTWAILAITSLGVVVALLQTFLPSVALIIIATAVILIWIGLVTWALIKKRRFARAKD